MVGTVGNLNAKHIGMMVKFRWRFPGCNVIADIAGELREVHHHPEGTSVWLAGPDSQGIKKEFTVGHDIAVAVFALDGQPADELPATGVE